MTKPFQVGLTPDFATEAAGLLDPILAEYFGPLPQIHATALLGSGPEITPAQIQGYDAVIALATRFTRESFAGVEQLAVIARWGVGYDMIDVQACTDNDVLLCITRDAVRRPVAEGIITLLLALTKHVLPKDRLVRAGRWGDKNRYPGIGLAGRTFGSVGVGNIGVELFGMLQPFGLGRLLAYDPYVVPSQVEGLGVEMVDLDRLLAESDFVSINCPLTPSTFHLINAAQLRRMQPTALLINTARGPIIDQVALTHALQEGWIAGAALDVFEEEPLSANDPLAQMDNVILSPHAVAWTDELVRGNGVGACQHVLSILRGEVPVHSVNREVIDRPGFQAKLQALKTRWEAYL